MVALKVFPRLVVGLALLVMVKPALLVAVDMALLGASWSGLNAHSHLSDNLASLGSSW